MAKKKKTESADNELKRVIVAFYPEEQEVMLEKLDENTDIERVSTSELNSRDVRMYFGLKPTHRSVGTRRAIMDKIKDMSEEKQKEILAQLEEE